jgi:hypothetical protein
MKNMFRNTVIAALFLGAVGILAAEVVEEETWYDASGKVVKKVKRTLTGADANPTPDWDPQWVSRERRSPSRVIRYSSGRSGYGTRYYSPLWYGTTYYRGHHYTPRRSGFSGFYHGHGSGGSHWGVNYSGAGVSVRYRH